MFTFCRNDRAANCYRSPLFGVAVCGNRKWRQSRGARNSSHLSVDGRPEIRSIIPSPSPLLLLFHFIIEIRSVAVGHVQVAAFHWLLRDVVLWASP